MNITTYQSIKAWPDKRWLASLDIHGDGKLLMSFFAPTEAEAVQAANRWWQARLDRQSRLEAFGIVPVDLAATQSDGREVMGGKIWMLNRLSGDRKRINESELTLYQQRGYVKCGPRGK